MLGINSMPLLSQMLFVKAGLVIEFHRISSLGYPAFSGTCEEIYLERCLEIAIAPKVSLVARNLGMTSLMFLCIPQLRLYRLSPMHKLCVRW